MKKFLFYFIAAAVVMTAMGCAGTPDFTSFEADQGVIMPAMMMGEKGDEFDGPNLQFTAPKPIAVSSDGTIFVAAKAFDLSKFTADGKFITVLGEKGKGKGQWNYPKGLAINSKGQVVISDAKNLKILVLDQDGKFVKEFGEKGDAEDQFGDLGPVAVDAEDNIYVSDEGTVVGIKKYTADGEFVKVIVPQVEDGTPGTKALAYLAINSELGRLYAGDDGDGDIDVYDIESGELLFSFAGHGENPGEFAEDIDGLAIGPYDLVFAMNTDGGKIHVYTSEGDFVTAFGKAGIYEGEFAAPEGIAYDPANNRIVVADEKNFRVQSFNLSDIGL